MTLTVDRTVTWGNIVSWVMIIISVVFGYAKLESATQQNTKDVAAAVELAKRVEESARAMDARRDTQINSLTVIVAETKITVNFIDKKIDELIRRKQE